MMAARLGGAFTRATGGLRRLLHRRGVRPALFALAGVAGALAALLLAPSGAYQVGPGEVRVAAHPSFRGATVLALPPFGTVEARTHDAPLTITLSPSTIDVPDVERLLERRPSQEALLSGLVRDRDRALIRLALRLGATGAAGGLLAFLLLRGRRVRDAAAAAAAGALVVAVLLALTLVTFDQRAFRDYRLTGAISRAPELVGPAEELAERFEAFRRQLDRTGSAAFRVYRFLAEQSTLPADAVRVLHISDLHLNPVGLDVALQVAGQFDVAAVVDTGDITAEGTDVEAAFVRRIPEFRVPYVFVRGNHDSAATEGMVRIQPNAIVLDGETTTVAGITFFGVGDPLYTPGSDLTTSQQRQAKERFAPSVARMVAEHGPAPDAVLVHDRVIARDLVGEVPLVLAGHGHRFFGRADGDTLTLAVGSTGAAGLQTLEPQAGEPIALQVLYFDRATRRLLAYDRIEVQGPRQEFFLQRTVLGEPEEREAG